MSRHLGTVDTRPNAVLRAAPFRLDNCVVAVASEFGQLAVMNPTARIIWDCHQAGLDLGGIVAELVAAYAVDPARARADVEAALAAWRECGLLGEAAAAVCGGSPGRPGGLLDSDDTDSLSRGWPSGLPVCGGGRPRADRGAHLAGHYILHDKAFRVRFGSKALAQAAAPLLRHLACAGTEAGAEFEFDEHGGAFELWRSGPGIVSRGSLARVLFALQSELIGLGSERDYLIAIHGAGVCDGERAIVLPGGGGSGKSTLTAALLYRGLGYLSDDVVPIDRSTRQAVPLPLALNLKPGSLPVLERFYPGIAGQPGISENGWTVHFFPPPGFAEHPPRGCYPVQALVFPGYAAGANGVCERISAVEALQRLIEGESLLPRPLEAAAVGDLVEWLQTMPTYRLDYASLDEACAHVRFLLP